MANLKEAKARFSEAREKVRVQRDWEGNSTKSGNKVYQEGYDAALYYITALEERSAVYQNAGIAATEEEFLKEQEKQRVRGAIKDLRGKWEALTGSTEGPDF